MYQSYSLLVAVGTKFHERKRQKEKILTHNTSVKCLEIAAIAPFLLGSVERGCFPRHQVSSQHLPPSLQPELSDYIENNILQWQQVISSRRSSMASKWDREVRNLRKAWPTCYLDRIVLSISLKFGNWHWVIPPLYLLRVSQWIISLFFSSES